MKHAAIISREQSLQILRNDLRKLSVEKHAAELQGATAEKRQEIMKRIEAEVDREVRQRAMKIEPGNLLH